MSKMLGVMLDCSRNAVLNVETVKKYAEIIAKMGYNTLYLYTEDTYEVDNQPYFGHLRGRYSKEELKEIDKFCLEKGIELIPCIQTLAHLEAMFKWVPIYEEVNDCDNILLIGEEKTYELIEDMISTLSQCFTSKKIHIGMDEAFRVGTGKYQQKHGIRDRFDIMNEHLHKVCDIVAKYGKEPIIFSDMFCKLALNVENIYEKADASQILEKAQLPDNVSLVYWDYYSNNYDHYAEQIRINKMFGRNVYFFGAAWTFLGLAPDNAWSLEATEAAVKACNDEGVDGIVMAVWGDNGGECPRFSILPSLMYAAEASRGNFDLDSIKKKFKEIVGADFDGFMLFDKLDGPRIEKRDNASKGLLYNDIFLGMRDCTVNEEATEFYKNLAKQIHDVSSKGEWGYLFDHFEKLAKVLSVKCNLGNRIRAAYKSKDAEAMNTVIKDCELALKEIKEYHEQYESLWFYENKPHGYDVQDLRLGGLMQRIESCTRRLKKFAAGEIAEIPELDEPVLDRKAGYVNWPNEWKQMCTPNII